MQGILDIAIPAVVLIPIILIGVAVWIGLKYNEKSSVVRRAEFLRLQRLAVEEQERAEREFELEYSLQRQGNPDPYYRRRESGENDYKKPHSQQEGWRLPDLDIRRRKKGEEEEYHKRQAEAAFHHQRMQAEVDEGRRREAGEDDITERKAEERERERRKAELEAHFSREAEEERRRSEDEGNRRRNEEEAQTRDAHHVSNIHCLVCENLTKRRCSWCKSAFYCSQACQLQHWKDGHKNECQPPDIGSPRGSEAGSEFLGD